jgi:hypothetical protein
LVVEQLQTSVEGELNQLKRDLTQLQPKSKPFSASPSPNADKSLMKVEIPATATISLEGILCYLTKKHGGNVDEKGLVTITSKSVKDTCPWYPLKNIADFATHWSFKSGDETGQWVCWDFHEMRVRPSHCTMISRGLKSWVVEGSLDGGTWTEIDRQTNNNVFESKSWSAALFTLSTPVESRFIRLTSTGRGHDGRYRLHLQGVEFFGTLFE